MERFATIITKRSILDVAAALDPSLTSFVECSVVINTTSLNRFWNSIPFKLSCVEINGVVFPKHIVFQLWENHHHYWPNNVSFQKQSLHLLKHRSFKGYMISAWSLFRSGNITWFSFSTKDTRNNWYSFFEAQFITKLRWNVFITIKFKLLIVKPRQF